MSEFNGFTKDEWLAILAHLTDEELDQVDAFASQLVSGEIAELKEVDNG